MIHVVNADGTTRYVSPSVERLLGYRPDEMVGRPAGETIHHDDLPKITAVMRQIPPSEASSPLEMRVRHRDGSWRVYEGIIRNLRDDAVVAGYIINSRDVTERTRSVEASQRLAAISRENPSPILECDADGTPLYANPAAIQMARRLGVHGVAALLPEGHIQLVRSCLESGEGITGLEVSLGEQRLSWTYHPYPRADVVHLFAADVTAQRRMEEQLRHDALHDALTGLPNRLLFMERLGHAAARSRRREQSLFAVLFLDLDRFKAINDGLGHHVGDELLRVVARRLQQCLRAEDTAARFGGDEFAILLEDLTAVHDAVRVAERILTEISSPFHVRGLEVSTSTSVGITLNAGSDPQPEELLRQADLAMYRAKAAGGARFEVSDR